MKAEYRQRWKAELKNYGDKLKKPQDLLNRPISQEDFIDSAILGGYPLADVLAGKVQEWEIPREVITAFHAQYPGIHRSLVDEVRALHSEPDKLQGLINGVKGKLFEEHYVGYLNHTLPVGLHAELAQNANNPAWDIAIKDSHGHVQDALQAKATESLQYVKHALELHPNIDVVVPHDSFDHFTRMFDFGGHLVDAHGDTLADLTEHTTTAVDHATSAINLLDHPAFHVPELAILFACGQNFYRYRTGQISSMQAITNAFERSTIATVASGAAWLAAALCHKTVVGIPVGIGVRVWYGKWKKNRVLSLRLEELLSSVQVSRRLLEARDISLLLGAGT